jgi:hypothetical protein
MSTHLRIVNAMYGVERRRANMTRPAPRATISAACTRPAESLTPAKIIAKSCNQAYRDSNRVLIPGEGATLRVALVVRCPFRAQSFKNLSSASPIERGGWPCDPTGAQEGEHADKHHAQRSPAREDRRARGRGRPAGRLPSSNACFRGWSMRTSRSVTAFPCSACRLTRQP